VVLDDGTGAAVAPQGVSVPSGSSDLDVLSAAGDSFTQNSSGLVCGINGYPDNALQTCLNTSGRDFYYWSYWEGDPATNTWTYANVGPAEHTVSSGQTYVEGWRYQDPGPDSPAAPKPSVTPAAAFAQACPGVAPVDGSGGGSTGGGTSTGGASTGTTGTTVTTAPGAPGGSAAAASGAASTAGGNATPGAGTSSTTRGTPTGAAGPLVPTTAGAAGTSTTTSPDQVRASTDTATKVRHAAAPLHRGGGGNPALPIVVAAVLIACLGAAALVRWRRRPGEE
jgi:hypothetical protein